MLADRSNVGRAAPEYVAGIALICFDPNRPTVFPAAFQPRRITFRSRGNLGCKADNWLAVFLLSDNCEWPANALPAAVALHAAVRTIYGHQTALLVGNANPRLRLGNDWFSRIRQLVRRVPDALGIR